MKEAVEEASKGLRKNDGGPFGAVIVRDGKIIAKARNKVIKTNDPTAHAEVLAITAAANSLASWRLDDTSIYITLEPCSMCAGAILLARISKVIYGVHDLKLGACGSVINVLVNDSLNYVLFQ